MRWLVASRKELGINLTQRHEQMPVNYLRILIALLVAPCLTPVDGRETKQAPEITKITLLRIGGYDSSLLSAIGTRSRVVTLRVAA